MSAVASADLPPVRVADLMTRDVFSIHPECSLGQALDLLLSKSITGAPVVDDDGRPLGVLSLTDVAAAERELREARDVEALAPSSYYVDLLHAGIDPCDGLTVKRSDDALVRDFMTPVVVGVRDTDTAAEAARIMRRARIHRLLVLDGRQLAGIVTTLDLLRLVEELD